MKTIMEYSPITAERSGDTVTLKTAGITMSRDVAGMIYPSADGVKTVFPSGPIQARTGYSPAYLSAINKLAIDSGAKHLEFEIRGAEQGATYKFTGKEFEEYRGIIMPVRLDD
jgi:hypothetical protein